MKRQKPTSKADQQGSALIEFAICFAFFWMPLFLGTYQIGFNLIRSVQATQICRDAGHMYSQGGDFSTASYQNLLSTLMPTALQPSSNGKSIFYFTKIIYVDDVACSTGGLQPNSGSCPNYHQSVIVQQFPFGNKLLRDSSLGTPCKTQPGVMDSSGNFLASSYLKNPAFIVNSSFSINLALAYQQTSGAPQTAYVSELYVLSSDLDFWGNFGTTGDYAQSVF